MFATHVSINSQIIACICALCAIVYIAPARAGDNSVEPTAAKTTAKAGAMTMEIFLDRLMLAESGGNLNARNSRSTALGPYQFIASTWLTIARQAFAKEISGLNAAQILGLRTSKDLARQAAETYTRNNANYLAALGLQPTFPNLRLAFLVGPGGAARVLSAPKDTRISSLLGSGVIEANPFMANMTAERLMARTAREIESDPHSTAGVEPDISVASADRIAIAVAAKFAAVFIQPAAPGLSDGFIETASLVMSARAASTRSVKVAAKPKIEVACDLSKPSCRRWLALAERKQSKRRVAKAASN